MPTAASVISRNIWLAPVAWRGQTCNVTTIPAAEAADRAPLVTSPVADMTVEITGTFAIDGKEMGSVVKKWGKHI